MAHFVGKYTHEKNENLDEYFKIIGVPYIPRKMMGATHPTLEISVDENEHWTISLSTLLRTVVTKFKLGEDYEENMPGGIIKNNTILEDNKKLVTKSIAPNNVPLTRVYERTDEGITLTYKHEASGTEAKRYFKKVEQ